MATHVSFACEIENEEKGMHYSGAAWIEFEQRKHGIKTLPHTGTYLHPYEFIRLMNVCF